MDNHGWYPQNRGCKKIRNSNLQFLGMQSLEYLFERNIFWSFAILQILIKYCRIIKYYE